MKHLLLISTFYFLSVGFCCSQKLESDYSIIRKLPDWFNSTFHLTEYNQEYRVDKSMNPFYLEADFNNVGKLDIAIFIQNPETVEKGIFIKHQEDKMIFVLGAGTEFNEMSDFDWMELWKLYRQPTTEVTTFTKDFEIAGSELIKLKNVAIEVGREESPGNLISLNGTEYIWIHTRD